MVLNAKHLLTEYYKYFQMIYNNQVNTKPLNHNKMAKRLSRQEKIDKMVVDMINKMFEIAGHPVTYDDIKDRKDDWFNDWTITDAQYTEWKQWGKKYLQKHLNMYAKMADREMSMIGLMWGLKFETL